MHNGSSSGLPSGETVVFNSEVAALRNLGHEVVDFMPSAGSSLQRANVVWSRRIYRQVRELIERHRPEIVHAHAVLPDLTVSAFGACRDANVPVVQTLHNYRWLCVEGGLFFDEAYCESCLTDGDWKGVVRRCSRKSLVVSSLLTLNNRLSVKSRRIFSLVDQFLAVSNFVRDVHVRAGFPEDKVVVKYNGIPVEDDPIPVAEQPVVVFIGRLDVAKGTKMFLKLPSKMPDVQFKVAGVGPDEREMQRHFASASNVSLLGRIRPEEVRQIIRDAACVLVPSIVPETFGLVAAEALAAGAPVVASQIGGLKELVETSRGGRCVPPGNDPVPYAQAINAILGASRSDRQEMGACGWGFANTHLSLERTMDQLVSIYRSVIESRARQQGVSYGV